jgi:hypothetical protein
MITAATTMFYQMMSKFLQRRIILLMCYFAPKKVILPIKKDFTTRSHILKRISKMGCSSRIKYCTNQCISYQKNLRRVSSDSRRLKQCFGGQNCSKPLYIKDQNMKAPPLNCILGCVSSIRVKEHYKSLAKTA